MGFDNGEWAEVEADEVTLAKRADGGGYSEWWQYLGIMRRGAPETLILEALPVRKTSTRAPGPGPLREVDWVPIGSKYLAHNRIILHTDSARAYLHKFPLVHHTRVIHQKKKVAGRWLLPRYTRAETINLPTGETIDVLAGTQTIDGLWKRLRASMGESHGSDFSRIDTLVRYMQWRTWTTGVDPWDAFVSTLAR